MADRTRRHAANVPGPWFVDENCIDCDACRQCAPAVFGDIDDQAVVVRQPEGEDELRWADRAILICPTGAIGCEGRKLTTDGAWPVEMEDGVHWCGYNAESSFGASSWLAKRPSGNVLVDSPRFVPPLVRAVESLGGIAHILLSHKDDVADAARWAERFGARVWIHEADRSAAPFATDVLRGTEPRQIAPGLQAIPTPGHTRGSVVFHLEDRFLFTGDSLYFHRRRRTLSAFRDACWYSWTEQARSLSRLVDVPFEWVLPGHGQWHRAAAPEMRASLERCVAWMSETGR